MATTSPQVDVGEIGQALVSMVRDDIAAKEVRVEAVDDIVIVWLRTAPLSFSEEKQLYRVGARLLQAFPDAGVEFHLLNPAAFPEGASEAPRYRLPETAALVWARA